MTQVELFKGNNNTPALPNADQHFMEMLERLAKDPDVSPEKMHALLDVQERMLNKQAYAAYNNALMAVLEEIPPIVKTGMIKMSGTSKTGKEYKQETAYAKYEDIDDVIRPILRKHGLVLTHSIQAGDKVTVTTKITHTLGHFETSSMSSPIDTSGSKNNLQGAGSAVSYLKRYNTGCLLNLIYIGEDDDAQRGGMEFIADHAIANIRRLLAETGTDEKRFLESLQYAEIENIPAGAYTTVMNMLTTKKAAQERRKTDGGAA